MRSGGGNGLNEGDEQVEAAPSSSHAACGVPALRAPAHFASVFTYMAMLTMDKSCDPYWFSNGDEVFLFARHEQGTTYVIVPVFVEGGQVESPCILLGSTDLEQFEAELKVLLE